MKTITIVRHAALAVIFGLLGTFAGASVPGLVSSAHAASVAGLPDFADLAEKTGPAVVNIRTTEKIRPGQNVPGADD